MPTTPTRRSVLLSSAAALFGAAAPSPAAVRLLAHTPVTAAEPTKTFVLWFGGRGHVGAHSGTCVREAIMSAYEEGFVDPTDYEGLEAFREAGPFDTDVDAVRWLATHASEEFRPRRMPEWDGRLPSNAEWADAGYDTFCDGCGEETSAQTSLLVGGKCLCEDCTTFVDFARAGDRELFEEDLYRAFGRRDADGAPLGLRALDALPSEDRAVIPDDWIESCARVHYGRREIATSGPCACGAA